MNRYYSICTIFVLCSFINGFGKVRAETQVSGPLQTNTTWSQGGSPYIVTGNIVVMDGVVLEIEPGVNVKFDGEYSLYIDGSLKAEGTDSDHIVFTSNRSTPSVGDWLGIKFRSTSSSSIISRGKIEYADNGVNLDGASPTINHSIIANNRNGIACSWSNSGPNIYNSKIYGNIDAGIYLRCYGGGEISRNLITDNGIGVSMFERGILTENVIANNNYGYYLNSGGGTNLPRMSNNIFHNNSEVGVYVFGYPVYSSSGIVNNIVANNGTGIYLKDYQGAVEENLVLLNEVGIISDQGSYPSSLTLSNNNFIANDKYSVKNNRSYSDTINSTNNYWGTSNEAEVQSAIFDFFDDPVFGVIDYDPILNAHSLEAPISIPSGLVVTQTLENSIRLAWSRNHETDLAGYKIYMKTGGQQSYSKVIDVGNNVNSEIGGLETDATYYISLTAYDMSYDVSNDNATTIINESQVYGNESWYAEEIEATLSSGPNSPPVASFTATPSGSLPPVTVQLDYSLSHDSDGQIVDYSWEVNGSPVAVDPGPSNQVKQLSLTQSGTYVIALTITDNEGLTDRVEQTVVVESIKLSMSPTSFSYSNLYAIPSDQGDSESSRYSVSSFDFDETEALPQAIHPNRVVVKYFEKAAEKSRYLSRSSLRAKLHSRIESINTEIWEVEDSSALITRRAPGNYSAIEYIEPDFAIELARFPNDEKLGFQWGLHNSGANGGTPDADVDAFEAWDISTGGEVACAIVDTGVDLDHPDLVGNMWVNENEIADNGIDDDNNGYVDDVHGWDFNQRRKFPQDGAGHGTHVAGIMAAKANNGTGISGVNWHGKIMALKIFDDQGKNGWSSQAAQAIDYAVKMGVKCSNHSWGTYYPSRHLSDAIERAKEAGHLIIAAAGNSDHLDNDRFPFYPASYGFDNVVSVCATDHQDNRPYYSHFGTRSVDLCAPGNNIYSTLPSFGYGNDSGTSMAAPFVAGAATLLWSQRPDLTASEVKQIILSGVDRKDQLASTSLTGGRLNLYGALSLIEGATKTFTITNTGVERLTLSETTLGGINPESFQIHDDLCISKTLEPNETCSLRVSFSPKVSGSKVATLEIRAGDSQVSSTLQGNADHLSNSDGGTQSGDDADGDGIPNDSDPYPETLAGQNCASGQRYLTLAYTTLTGNQACEAESKIFTGASVKIGDDLQGTNVVFKAGNAIRFYPGFSVTRGSSFRALTTGGDGDEPIGGVK